MKHETWEVDLDSDGFSIAIWGWEALDRRRLTALNELRARAAIWGCVFFFRHVVFLARWHNVAPPIRDLDLRCPAGAKFYLGQECNSQGKVCASYLTLRSGFVDQKSIIYRLSQKILWTMRRSKWLGWPMTWMTCQGYGSQKRSCLHWVNCENTCAPMTHPIIMDNPYWIDTGLIRCGGVTVLQTSIAPLWGCFFSDRSAGGKKSSRIYRLSIRHTNWRHIFREHQERSEHHRTPSTAQKLTPRKT